MKKKDGGSKMYSNGVLEYVNSLGPSKMQAFSDTSQISTPEHLGRRN